MLIAFLKKEKYLSQLFSLKLNIHKKRCRDFWMVGWVFLGLQQDEEGRELEKEADYK